MLTLYSWQLQGRSRADSPENMETLKERLTGPEGFGSYKEIQKWLRENYNPDITYKTVHKTVRYYPCARTEMPRPSNIKKW